MVRALIFIVEKSDKYTQGLIPGDYLFSKRFQLLSPQNLYMAMLRSLYYISILIYEKGFMSYHSHQTVPWRWFDAGTLVSINPPTIDNDPMLG